MKVVVNPNYISEKEIYDFIYNITEHFEKEGVVLYDARNVVKSFILPLANGESQKLVVKRFRKSNFFQRIIYTFFKASKAERSYRHAAILRERGFDTPSEVAYVEDYAGGLLRQAYYVSGFNDAPPIVERYGAGAYDKQLADEFAVFVAQLHEKNILHGDLNSTNVIYRMENGHFHFALIDLNRMRTRPLDKHFSRKACLENLTRYCGRPDLYAHVLYRYAEYRKWDVMATLADGLTIKKVHDSRWIRRKNLIHKYIKHKK